MTATSDDKNVPVVKSPEIKADHTWYNSLFVQLLAPLVATRYLWLAIEDLNPKDFLRKNDPSKRPDFKPFVEPKGWKYASHNFTSFSIGTMFMAIVGAYSRNTLHDIKSLYAESVGYELGKKTEDVTFSDIFIKSKNTAVETTRNAYVSRTLARFATASSFFIPWQKLGGFYAKGVRPKYAANANMGIGAVGAHLYAEGLLREPSFFDVEQKMVSSKIKHKDVNPYGAIQVADVQAMLHLYRKQRNKHYRPPSAVTQEGQDEIALANRVADLFNQTYHNMPNKEHADLTIGKFNFLIGFGMLDKFPESMAFVELANRSKDMSEVKQAAAAIQAGKNPKEVFSQFGIELNQPAPSPVPAAPEAGEKSFTKRIAPMAEKTAMQAQSFQDRVAQTPPAQLTI